ncbi:hypothetical protein LTR62_001802 [Meristemomyces frigidus]|uniref:Rab proteins geranylgeranyltransferase n=1 Tax=Meristemomyces frigidus TaxID=1508187 RepID=A0AAN7TK22_9PEZI|nr:hypothetical protein LTR62_001802 [Meristemomyces frigidus]
MESLDNTEWDVVISGTGLPQSLLALSLSRSGKRVLHVDRNSYYGGYEAALSLSEAEEWAKKHAGDYTQQVLSCFTNASTTRTSEKDAGGSKLGFSRAYSLALAPQLIYARSNLLPALVSSRTHNQLDFQAIGSWFVVNGQSSADTTSILRVPSGREDVFRDDSLGLRAKRSLMKFMRFVARYDEESEKERWDEIKHQIFTEALQSKFGLNSDEAIAPLLALAMTPGTSAELTMERAVPSIARHFRSIGMFGAGFGAVLPKWGGLAEIAQVACRACAVGGGVYVLGQCVESATEATEERLVVELSGGERVTTTWLVGLPDDVPLTPRPPFEASSSSLRTAFRGIYIVSSPLDLLFPPTSEGGPIPAGAVVRVEMNTAAVYILAHSSDSGESPSGQCVLYASSIDNSITLDSAVQYLLQSLGEEVQPRILWQMQYQQHTPQTVSTAATRRTIYLPPLTTDLIFADEVLDSVMQAWQSITGSSSDDFMRFEARRHEDDEEANA